MRSTPFMRAALTLALLVGFAREARAGDPIHFNKGSLIIPVQHSFQPAEGMLSAYGLVYRILQANAPGHKNANHPVTVYIANNEGKNAPNRCIPTNNSVFNAAVGNQADPKWKNDGCDFTISNAFEQPVVPVDYSIAYPATNQYADAAIPTFDDANAWPRYNWSGITLQRSLSATAATATQFSSISYLGAPFVISDADAPYVIDLIRTGDTSTDPTSPAVPKAAIDVFSDTQKAPAAASHCDASNIAGAVGERLVGGGLYVSAGCHYVIMHQATIGFDATVSRRINVAPPPFALFETTKGSREGQSGAVLPKYIQEAGLWVRGSGNGTDSQGCPIGNVTHCTLNGSPGATAGTEAPASKVHRGNIYDFFDIEDLDRVSATYPNGPLNQLNAAGDLVYQLFWAPHWEAQSDSYGNDNNGIKNIVKFVASQGNVLTECASITSYEDNGVYQTGVGGPANAPGSNFLFTNQLNYGDGANSNKYVTPTGSQVGTQTASATFMGQNCTDPDNSGGACVTFPDPGNVFSQLGDWKFQRSIGKNQAFGPASGSNRQPWTKRMVTSNDGNGAGQLDDFIMGQQDKNHGVVIYVAGHDVSGSGQAVGSRVVLNSMLNLSFNIHTSDRGLASPVISPAITTATTAPDEVLSPTYESVVGYSSNPAVKTYDPTAANLFTFPYYPGDLRAHDMSALALGEQKFSNATLWNAGAIGTPGAIAPTPGGRNLFTYFGGYPLGSPVMPGGGKAFNDLIQRGWVPEKIEATLLSNACGLPATGCVDVMGVPPRVGSPDWDDLEHYSDLHMVRGADGLCDLQEMVNYSKLNGGNDWGSGADCTPNNIAKFLLDEPAVANLITQVRGYCYASLAQLAPGDGTCADPTEDNRAHLGGIVHSSPAVVGPSTNIGDLGGPRPTVAYVGSYDGQLHAFYVGGGSGYKGPTTAATFASGDSTNGYDPDASTKFKTALGGTSSTPFTPPAVGTELWSFIPASQLPHLFDNSAQVDSSPVVMDVFADFSGTGLREWHTVLVASIGIHGDEIFAMDVTNPLKPRMLWDIAGSLFRAGDWPKYSPTLVLNDDLISDTANYASCTHPDKKNFLPGSCVVPKWIQGQANYFGYPANDPGRQDTKPYDFGDLAGAAGLAMAEVRNGLEPQYLVYVTTNWAKDGKGIEVMALDAVTGQRVWQWERKYQDDLKVDNSVPAPPTVVFGQNGASRLLVGDLEGHVWELDAKTGVNVNVSSDAELTGCTATNPCEFPAFDDGSTDAEPQPISTNIALAKVPADATGLFANYKNATVMIFGTAGVNWLGGKTATTRGRLHVVLYDKNRVPIFKVSGNQLDGTTAWTAPAVKGTATNSGVLQEIPGFPDVFPAGERLYGTITVSGKVAFFNTATGTVPDDVMQLADTTGGHTYEMSIGYAAAGAIHNSIGTGSGAFGGVAVYVSNGVTQGAVIDEPGKLNYIKNPAPPPGGSAGDANPNSTLSPTNGNWTYRLRNWLTRMIK